MVKQSNHHKITPTADLISYYRPFSDTPFTREIAQITGAEKIVKQMLKEDFKNSYFLAVMSEARYKKIDLCAKGFTNILELAVGRSPRGLIFTENPSINYVATDLPDSLKNYKTIMKELIKRHKLKRHNLHFAPANALNRLELECAERLLPEGPLAIISEGMITYFPKDEKKKFLSNIYPILERRGGVYITCDIATIPPRNNHEISSRNSILDSIAKIAGRDMRECSFADENEAGKFVNECGFDYGIFNPPIDLISLKKLKLENDPLAQRTANRPIWILKVKK